MSAFPRLASVSVASAAAIGLVVPIVVAPPVAADPCAQTASAAAQNRAQAPQLALGAPVLHTPTGRKPAGADDQAPLPTLGPLPAADPGSAAADPPSSAPKQNRAAILPVVPGPGQPAPNPAQPAPNAAAPQAAAAPAPAAAAAAPSTTIAGWVNGPSSPNNTYQRFGISGADLGILWDNGQTGTNNQVLIAFGDTFGNCSLPDQQWRSNTMFRSSDRDLSNGIDVPNAAQKAEFPVFGDPYASSPIEEGSNLSRQIIDSLRLPITEVTVIPTAGISVGTTQYVNFMSVKQWGNPGQWTTNFSAIAVSTNNGDNWAVNRATTGGVRPARRRLSLFVRHAVRTQRFRVCVARPGGLCARPHEVRILGQTLVELLRESILGPKQSRERLARHLGAGKRDVRSVQHLSQEVRGALLRRSQQRRDADSGRSPGAVELGADPRHVNADSGRSLRPVHPPLVFGPRPLLQPVAVVRLQRDVDAHHAALTRQGVTAPAATGSIRSSGW
jgi:hypothetical protein